MANRLADSTSPYLLQHKNNPVDWYPWGEEAFGRARREDKPIFLSVGYSSCHWCHVMEHESFEDEGVAKLLNESFVSIKVDREERPDVDEAFMAGVQLSSGRGGWPMSVFLTPDLKPFFAGTYFPKEDREGSPGFRTVLAQIASGWSKKRSEFQKAADEFAQAIGQHLTREAPKTFAKPSQEILDNAVRAIASEFDQDNGGFGGAPKFPPHSTIAFLLEYAAAENSPEDLAQVALSMALLTLEAMALGGIHDHVGGGFHRYSTDAEWILPHFEKMLYDNALLLENYANAARLTLQAEPQLGTYFAETAAKIIEWLNHRMAAENGLYGSALDADSEGTEGKYYVWTVDELRSTLGGRADRFMESFSVRAEGNYHDESTGTLSGKNILYNSEHADEPFEEELEALLHSRNGRTPPSYDDKQIVAWNALLLSGFVMAGEIEVAEGIARAILDAEREHGRLPHQIGDGKPAGDAFLDDYAALVLGLWSLAAAIEATEEFTGNARWQAEAERLQDKMVALFYDSEEGGFFYTSSAHEELFGRSKPVFDQPIPSGNAMAIQALVRSGDLDRAGKSLQPLIGWMERVPHATESLLIALLDLLEAENSDRPIRESAAPPLSPQTTEVSVAIIPKEIRADGRGTGKGTVVFQIPNGMHLNSHEPPARWLIPTCVTVQPLNARVDYPPAQNDEYSGKLEIPFTVELPAGEGGADFEVKVTYQACDDKACQLPEEKSLSGVLVRG